MLFCEQPCRLVVSRLRAELHMSVVTAGGQGVGAGLRSADPRTGSGAGSTGVSSRP